MDNQWVSVNLSYREIQARREILDKNPPALEVNTGGRERTTLMNEVEIDTNR